MMDAKPAYVMVMHRRVVAMGGDDRPLTELSRQVKLAMDELHDPNGPNLFHDGHEADYRKVDPDCDAVCAEISSRLEAASGAPLWVYGNSPIYDFTGHQDLEWQWQRALDRARTIWLATLPPLPVKEGDFVEVGGCVLLISRVDLERRTVSTQRLGPDGSPRSEIPGVKADGLRPLAPPVDFTRGWDEPAPGDGLQRARATLRSHQGVLEAAGLVPPDD